MAVRVGWDTNPLVSALIKPAGVPRQLFALGAAGRIEIVVSPTTLQELDRVLRLPRIRNGYTITEMEIAQFIDDLRNSAIIAPGALVVDAVPDDPHDNHVLAAAVETDCQFVVSGDSHLLQLGVYESIAIVNPRDLLTLLQQTLAE